MSLLNLGDIIFQDTSATPLNKWITDKQKLEALESLQQAFIDLTHAQEWKWNCEPTFYGRRKTKHKFRMMVNNEAPFLNSNHKGKGGLQLQVVIT